MSDTTITPEEKAELRELADKSYLLPLNEDEVPSVGFDGLTDERIAYIAAACNSVPRILDALEQVEARAEELEEYIAKLVCELTDGKLSKPYDISVITDEVEIIYRAYAEDEIAKATAKTEAEVARLTKMADWLADKMADISDKMNSPNAPAYCVACNICPVGDNELEGQTCRDTIEEAASRAVAAGEE